MATAGALPFPSSLVTSKYAEHLTNAICTNLECATAASAIATLSRLPAFVRTVRAWAGAPFSAVVAAQFLNDRFTKPSELCNAVSAYVTDLLTDASATRRFFQQQQADEAKVVGAMPSRFTAATAADAVVQSACAQEHRTKATALGIENLIRLAMRGYTVRWYAEGLESESPQVYMVRRSGHPSPDHPRATMALVTPRGGLMSWAEVGALMGQGENVFSVDVPVGDPQAQRERTLIASALVADTGRRVLPTPGPAWVMTTATVGIPFAGTACRW
jgi:hypothetical protein